VQWMVITNTNVHSLCPRIPSCDDSTPDEPSAVLATHYWKSFTDRGRGDASSLLRPIRLPDRHSLLLPLHLFSWLPSPKTHSIASLSNSKDLHVLFLDICPLHCFIIPLVRTHAETLIHSGLVRLWMATWLRDMNSLSTRQALLARHGISDPTCDATPCFSEPLSKTQFSDLVCPCSTVELADKQTFGRLFSHQHDPRQCCSVG
jgi:hypothetical protein